MADQKETSRSEIRKRPSRAQQALEALLHEERRADVRVRSDRYGCQWLEEHSQALAAAAVAWVEARDAPAELTVRCYRRDSGGMDTCPLERLFTDAPPGKPNRAGQIVLPTGEAVSSAIVHAARAALCAARGA